MTNESMGAQGAGSDSSPKKREAMAFPEIEETLMRGQLAFETLSFEPKAVLPVQFQATFHGEKRRLWILCQYEDEDR